MTTKIFVNLAVKNLDKSIEFFKGLGFAFNPQFTDETAACMVISDDSYAMLLTEAKFKEFTQKEIADATKTTEVLTCLAVDSKDEVNQIVDTALKSGRDGSPGADGLRLHVRPQLQRSGRSHLGNHLDGPEPRSKVS